ncbi:hypothetical protein B0H10DRAFT_1950486 [Mycena sp. CBHHK59/15]|nr:hypothetical protein B0H10DRAFT_1950486 [Mycena sp. CBHHK59/15]
MIARLHFFHASTVNGNGPSVGTFLGLLPLERQQTQWGHYRATRCACSAAPAPWFPVTLANLVVSRPIGKPALRPQVVSEEALYTELLGAEHSEEEPDAGALEGSGDDFKE